MSLQKNHLYDKKTRPTKPTNPPNPKNQTILSEAQAFPDDHAAAPAKWTKENTLTGSSTVGGERRNTK